MATQKQEEPAIRVDQSRKYPTSAGTCDKCGYSKTWEFKIAFPAPELLERWAAGVGWSGYHDLVDQHGHPGTM